MKLLLPIIPFLSCVPNHQVVDASAGLFTYYEDPFLPSQDNPNLIFELGPARWRNLNLLNNECGGNGQINGFGQSPIVISPVIEQKCDTDLSGYEFEQGDCTWDELFFQILTNGVWVGPNRVPGSPNILTPDVVCNLGRMKIPGDEQWYIANQFHIHSNSEHSVAGSFYAAELHVVHVREDGKQFAVFAMFIDRYDNPDDERDDGVILDKEEEGGENSDPEKHDIFEYYLQGWEAVAKQSEEYCASNPEGHGQFTPNALFTSIQDLVQCPAVGSEVDNVDNLTFVDEVQLLPFGWNNSHTISVPELQRPVYPSGVVPSLYETLPTYQVLPSEDNRNGGLNQSSVYSYRGGLTTPPCTEGVRWNILSKPMIVSKYQLNRLLRLILCFVERSTCRHATVANHFGGTNRPMKPLAGRRVLHRCARANNIGNATISTANAALYYSEEGSNNITLDDPLAPTIPTPFKRRCLNTLSPYQNPGQCIPIDEEVWISILWPCLMLISGVGGYFLLSRYCSRFPITALMFLLGMVSGIIASITRQSNNAFTQSTLMWEDINPELLLMTFLPGLLFGDAFGLNISLLKDAWLQCFIMAFPLVLIGTALTALVGVYILPYGWNIWMGLTWGSILSATDPVAVSSLLKECGAPPRLKVLIAGESLFNDGSAIVFFTIFAQKWYTSLNVLGFGQDVDVAQGFAIFFRMSLGAMAIGIPMGFILVFILRLLSRRFSHDDSIVQVIAILSVTYLNYYINDTLVFMSGVISVVTQGIIVKTWGQNYILGHIFHSFWEVLESVLNGLIFSVGGLIFGGIISNQHPLRITTFGGKDWGYTILAYLLVNLIRFALMFGAYPILSRIGLKWNVKEAIFVSFGGLRGAIAIALAISLDSELRRDTAPGDPRRDEATDMFGVTGGIVLFSLVFNGTFAGPLLRRLGLGDSSSGRLKIVEGHISLVLKHVMLTLSTVTETNPKTFNSVDLDILREHVPLLQQLSDNELLENLPDNVERSTMFNGFATQSNKDLLADLDIVNEDRVFEEERVADDKTDRTSNSVNETMKEERKVFIDLLRGAYRKQIANGEVDVKRGHVVFALQRSVDYTENDVAQGEILQDWDYLNKPLLKYQQAQTKCCGADGNAYSSLLDPDESEKVYRTIAFLRAHCEAEAVYCDALGLCSEKLEAYKESAVMKESLRECEKAREYLQTVKNLNLYATYTLCDILLHSAANFILKLEKDGLISEREAEEMIHNTYSKNVKKLRKRGSNLSNDDEL